MRKVLITLLIGLSTIALGVLNLNNLTLKNNSNEEEIIKSIEESAVNVNNNINENNNFYNSNNNQSKEIAFINNSLSYQKKSYETIDDFTEDYSAIVIGEVISANGISNKEGDIYTDLEIKVKDVICGDIDDGTVMPFRLRGGEMVLSEYINVMDEAVLEKRGLKDIAKNNSENKIVRNYVDSREQYKMGDKVCLFLKKVDVIPEVKGEIIQSDEFYINKSGYAIIGASQGHFYYDENTNEIFRYKPNDNINELSKVEINKVRELTTNIEEFKDKLRVKTSMGDEVE